MLTLQPGNPQKSGYPDGRLALLGSLCLFLSAIEYLIPKPLPFMRIGLANVPLLLALDMVKPREYFLLACIKVLGQGIIGGTFFSYVFVFSLAGTFASAAVMYLLRSLLGKKTLGFPGLGCAGALASNGIQLFLARFFIFGPALRFLVPPFLASGFTAGLILGLMCGYFCRHSQWYNNRAGALTAAKMHVPETGSETNEDAGRREKWRLRRNRTWNTLFNADELFITGLLITLIFLFNRSLESLVVYFALFIILAWISGKKINAVLTIVIISGIVFFNLLSPYGKVLAVIGPFRITQGSLFSGLEKALTLQGLVMLSRAFIKPDLRLPGSIGCLLGESLRILGLMHQRKSSINKGTIVKRIDTMLLELESMHNVNQDPCIRKTRSFKGIILLCIMVSIAFLIGRIW